MKSAKFPEKIFLLNSLVVRNLNQYHIENGYLSNLGKQSLSCQNLSKSTKNWCEKSPKRRAKRFANCEPFLL